MSYYRLRGLVVCKMTAAFLTKLKFTDHQSLNVFTQKGAIWTIMI